MTAALRKAAERRRRAARGEVALAGWLSASDHAALTQMARDSGMTQAQVVSRLIGMVRELKDVELWNPAAHGARGMPDGWFVSYSDLTATVGL